MKKQVVIIHGADTFATYEEYISFLKNFTIDTLDYFTKKGWKDSLQKELGEEFEVIAPKMPNKWNARYVEWKIWFEKLIPLLNSEVVFVGHSMGGMFLAKYLSENAFSKKIKGVFLVASPYSAKDSGYVADFMLPEDLDSLNKQAAQVYMYHSEDDTVVPFNEFIQYKKKLPNTHAISFKDRGHFNQEFFPEIVRDIKSLF